MTGTMWLSDAMTGRPASDSRRLQVSARSWCRSRSALLALRWRTLASAPAAIAGGSAVVKMKPAAKLRTKSMSAAEAAI